MNFRLTHREWMVAGLMIATVGVVGCGSRGSKSPSAEPSNQATSIPTSTSTAQFEDVAAHSGVSFVAHNGNQSGHLAILESLGTGVGLLDYDRDGRIDIFFPGGGTFSEQPEPVGLAPGLFRQAENLQFEAVTLPADVAAAPFYSHGINVGDIDSDGFQDLLISGYHGVLLYRNQGDGTFVDCTAASGLTSNSWSTSTAWGDANGDGVLDLYIANYVDWSFEKHPACIVQGHRDICAPKQFEAQSDVFFVGNGDGTFRDATSESGLVAGGKGLGVVAADLDLDGDLDYYVANDTTPNFLYQNDGRGHFDEIGLSSGTAFGENGEAEGSMGVDVGDFNGDGLPDVWVANFENQSFALYRNQGHCRFQHVSAITGITSVGAQYVGFGTAFFDFDLDGDEDLFSTNGHVMYYPANAPLRQKPLLFENLNGKRFVNVAETAGDYTSTPHLGRGVAVGDLDRDGDPDLVIAHANEPVALLRNDSTTSGNVWVKVRLIGTHSHRDAVGARITVVANGHPFTKHVKGGASYLSSSVDETAFGLGPAATIDSIEVVWPGGGIQRILSKASIRSSIIVVERSSESP